MFLFFTSSVIWSVSLCGSKYHLHPDDFQIHVFSPPYFSQLHPSILYSFLDISFFCYLKTSRSKSQNFSFDYDTHAPALNYQLLKSVLLPCFPFHCVEFLHALSEMRNWWSPTIPFSGSCSHPIVSCSWQKLLQNAPWSGYFIFIAITILQTTIIFVWSFKMTTWQSLMLPSLYSIHICMMPCFSPV